MNNDILTKYIRDQWTLDTDLIYILVIASLGRKQNEDIKKYTGTKSQVLNSQRTIIP